MITWHSDHETIAFAKSELLRYCKMLDPNVEPVIDFCSLDEAGKRYLLNGEDEQLCDAYYIDIENARGRIAASNPRSILLGVYRLLKEAGCRFIRPGIDGEVVPAVDFSKYSLQLECKARHLHRGITIEGAVSFENIMDMIDWAPKVGFNAYFIQFKDGHEFFEKWYKHRVNPHKEAEEYTREHSVRNRKLIAAEIKKRNMLFHAVGHGWTCDAIGVDAGGWHKYDASQLSSEDRELLALVDGKREYFEGIPLNTQLCYSNPKARQRIVDGVIHYVKTHPEVDVLHFWLGDNYNNFCECEDCVKIMPADQYVMLLNEIDARLSEIGSSIKVVFLIYYELLWTPEKEAIKNPDRFIMMFAPINREYTRSYLNAGDELKPLPEIMPFERNKIKFPRDCEVYLAFLDKWQQIFKGDSFVFDYHLMWDINRDFGGMRLSKVVYEDIVALKRMKLNGYVSCQQNRAFFPTGLAMYIMGNTLVNPSLDYKQLKEEYFSAAFGPDYKPVMNYLEEISELFSFEYNCDLVCADERILNGIKQGASQIEKFISRFEGFKMEEHSCCRKSWDILQKHAVIYKEVAALLIQKLEQDGMHKKDMEEAWRKTMDHICLMEDDLQPYLDFEFFNMITGGLLKHGLDS